MPNELPDTADWKAFDAQFAAWEPGIIELRKFDVSTPRGRIAIAYHGGNPIDIKLDQTQHIRTAAFALAWDALRSSHAGRPDPALGSASAGLHLIRSIDFEPTLITCLIRLGSAQAILQSVEQTLAWCRVPSEKSLVEVQELVALESGHTSMRTAQRGDRALMLHMFDLIDRGEIGLESTKPDRDLGTFINKQHLPTNSVYILDRYSEFQTMLELPPAEKATAIRNWQMPPRTRENLMGHLMMPAINKVALADIRYQAKCVCTAAGIVCERYRLKHGKWPAALDDLAEFGIRKGLIDPFDGQPLRYAVKEDGIVIYSVGTDDRDDGGDVVGRGQAQNDTGFRLWNPDRRKVPSPDKQMLEELPQP